MIYLFSWILSLILAKVIFKRRLFGRENAPKKGPFILVSNHASYADPFLLGTSLPCRKWFYYLAKKELFDSKFGGWYLRKIHAIPLDRRGDVATIKMVVSLLKTGRPVVLFPEGTRSPGGRMGSAKPGLGFIIAKAGVPVLPAYIEGSYEAMPSDIRSIRPRRVNVYIGKPLYFGTVAEKKKETYQWISDEIMHSISALRDEHAGKSS